MVGRSEVLAIVPARGGSRGLPRKNVKELGGCPLIAYIIATSLRARTVSRVIVSTDDGEIAEIAVRFGAEVPFMRPIELAADDTPDLPVFLHALEWLETKENFRPEIIVHLRPTSPFCRPEEIDLGVQLLLGCPETDSVRMVCPPFQNPFKMWQIGDDGFLVPLTNIPISEPYNQPRQKLPPAFLQCGLDIIRRRTILEQKSMTGHKILPLVSSRSDWDNWVDIDNEVTLKIADFLLQTGNITVKSPLPCNSTSATETPAQVRRRSLTAQVKLLVLDFDGVLTDNHVWVSESGGETVAVNRSDGMGIAALRERGIEVIVLSSEANPVVEARCQKLQIPCHSGVKNKLPVLQRIMSKRGLQPKQVAYVGNDVNDLECMEAVGFNAAVQDAHPQVLDRADLVLNHPGGHGAVREICDLIIKLLK